MIFVFACSRSLLNSLWRLFHTLFAKWFNIMRIPIHKVTNSKSHKSIMLYNVRENSVSSIFPLLWKMGWEKNQMGFEPRPQTLWSDAQPSELYRQSGILMGFPITEPHFSLLVLHGCATVWGKETNTLFGMVPNHHRKEITKHGLR